VAVVVSLVVLIAEIRGNTDEVRAATLTNLAGRTQTMIMANLSNTVWQEATIKEAQGEDLSLLEERLLDQALGLRMKYAEESFMAFRDGRLDEEVWQTRANQLLGTLISENDRRRWSLRRGRGTYVQDFVDWVDSELSKRHGE
jgi:hypothetical protein